MEQTFTYAKGWKIFTFLFTPAMFFGGCYLFYLALQGRQNATLLISGALFAYLFAVYCFWDIIKRKTVVSDYSIIQINVFSRKEILCSDIKGFKASENNLYILSKIDGKTKVIISYVSYIGDKLALFTWLYEKFDDLDDEAYNDQLDEILEDPEIGVSPDDRLDNLKRVKTICSWLNNIGLGIAFWLFLYPNPYNVAVLLAMLYPLVVMYVQYRFRNIVKLDDDNVKSAYPSLISALLFPALGLFVRTLLDFDLLKFTDCLLPVGLISLPLSLIFVLIWNNTLNKPKSKAGSILAIAFFVVIYAYSSCITINCNFDYSTSRVYPTLIMDHRVTTGKHTTYYLTLNPWGPKIQAEEVTVSKSFYNQVNIGDTVNVNVKKGVLNVPWFYVSR